MILWRMLQLCYVLSAYIYQLTAPHLYFRWIINGETISSFSIGASQYIYLGEFIMGAL